MGSTLLLVLLAPVACAPAPQDPGESGVPVIVEETAGVDRPAGVLTGGLPFGEGELADGGAFELQLRAERLPAFGRVSSRWPDGSVRWLTLEFPWPAQEGGARLEARLGAGGSVPLPGADFEVFVPSGRDPLRAGNGRLTVSAGQAAGELFAWEELFDGALRFTAESTGSGFEDLAVQPGEVSVESQTPLSLTLHRIDEWGAEDEPPVFRLITRARMFRDSGLVRLDHTLQVLRGSHRMERWDLELPLRRGSGAIRFGWEDQRDRSESGDFRALQQSHDRVLEDGRSRSGRLSGAVAGDGWTLAAAEFWQTLPKGVWRRGDLLVLELCPVVDGRAEVLEAGFGRTVTLWLWLGDAADEVTLEQAAAVASRPLLPRTTPERYSETRALGLLAARPGGGDRMDAVIRRSIERVYRAIDAKPEFHYGIQHWGDFHDREHTLSYFGALNQEYDPGLVLFLHFAQTGRVEELEQALVLARHYADVDTSHYGGVFQHRATIHHVNTWIARVFARTFAEQVRAAPSFDGSLESVWPILRKRIPGNLEQLRAEMAHDRELGVAGPDEVEHLLQIVGQLQFENLAAKMKAGQIGSADVPIRAYAEAAARSPQGQRFGYDDPEGEFRSFFDRYGGSWEDFPSFHVDISPSPFLRHNGGHSLVESVVFAHWLTGDPHFREVALAVAEHHVRYLVDWEIAKIRRNVDRGNGVLSTRLVGWPLVNLCRLWEMTQGMPREEAIHQEIRDTVSRILELLPEVPPDRVKGSIHAGVLMEGLVHYHQLTGDARAAELLIDLARYWAANEYDSARHAFIYQARGKRNAASGFSGLCVLGLAYAQILDPDPAVGRVLADAWEHLPSATKYSKSFAMLYRAAFRVQALLEDAR